MLKLHLLECFREVLCLNDLRQDGLGELKLNVLAASGKKTTKKGNSGCVATMAKLMSL